MEFIEKDRVKSAKPKSIVECMIDFQISVFHTFQANMDCQKYVSMRLFELLIAFQSAKKYIVERLHAFSSILVCLRYCNILRLTLFISDLY